MSPIPEWYQTFETELVEICAPTLAGLKAGSIFTVLPVNDEWTKEKIRKWDERLCPFGIRIKMLGEHAARSRNVYVYRPSEVQKRLDDPLSQEILFGMGYESHDLDECLERLSKRLDRTEEFPHEIGLFIGYPPEDVDGFIRHKGKNFCSCGLWKVYGDKEESEKYFSKCRKCQNVYQKLFREGRAVEQLTVHSRHLAKAASLKRTTEKIEMRPERILRQACA